jgi:hypothetical protein
VASVAVLLNINIQDRLEYLNICGFHDPASTLPLPSWVFNFSVPFQLTRTLQAANASGLPKQESIYDSSENTLAIYGRQICVIDQVFEAVPFDARLPEIIATCQSWELAGRDRASAFSMDSYITTLLSESIGGALHFDVVLDVQKLKTLYKTACEQRSLPTLGNDSSQTSQWAGQLQNRLLGRRLFMTTSGLMGHCPVWASEGDIVIVALGSKSPLILRPTEENRYQLGGECFVNGMMHGEGLLGPFSPGSRLTWSSVGEQLLPVIVDGNELPTQLDPKAGPLSPGWSVWYGEDDEPNTEIEDGRLKAQWFYHEQTEAWTQWDPRLTSENLKNMGIDIQEFVLV